MKEYSHSEQLVRVLEYSFNTRTDYQPPMSAHRAIYASPFRPGQTGLIHIEEDLSELERVYMLSHLTSHLMIGHSRTPFSTIIEPDRRPEHIGHIRLTPEERIQHYQADLVTRHILSNTIEELGLDIAGELGFDVSDGLSLELLRLDMKKVRLALGDTIFPLIGEDQW